MKRLTAIMLVVMFLTSFSPVLAQGGDDLGILDCLPPTQAYIDAVLGDSYPHFLLSNECGIISLEEDFYVFYSADMVKAAGLGNEQMMFAAETYPVITGDWNDTKPKFLDLADDTYPGGRHGLQLVRTDLNGAPTQVQMALVHTYYNPVHENHILMGEVMRLLAQNESWTPDMGMYIIQDVGNWRTTMLLRLKNVQIIDADLFFQADHVINGQISINLDTIGYQFVTDGQTLTFVGCFSSAGDWYGNRVVPSFEVDTIQYEWIGG